MRVSRFLRRWRPALALVLSLSLSFMGCGKTFLPADARADCTDTTDGGAPFASWFEDGVVTLDGVVKPADSVNFIEIPNCTFYQWSEQMFLWLTSPAPARYGGGGRIFNSPTFYDVSGLENGERTLIPHVNGVLRPFSVRSAQVGPHKLPVLFARDGRMLEIEPTPTGPTGKQLVLDREGHTIEVDRIVMNENRRPVFLDGAGRVIRGVRPVTRFQGGSGRFVQKFMVEKAAAIFIDLFGYVVDVGQGQADNGVLQAQNGSLVYYTTVVNDVYAYFLTGTKNGGISPTPTQFPTTQAELDQIVAFAAANGKTFPDAEALAVEAKLSWVEAAGLSNPDSYITMTALIPTYDTTKPEHWIQNGTRRAKLAMVGMHVVGSTADHPEMIWATFEHQNNMPNGAYAYINTSSDNILVPQITGGDWLFSRNSSTGPFNEQHMAFTPATTTDAAKIDAFGSFTISPSDTIRWKAWGAASDKPPNQDNSPAESNTEILSINNTVRSMLASGDVRGNYIMIGSTWTIQGESPSGSFDPLTGLGNEVGTSKLANGTMETYQQGTDTLFATGTNCFSCHQTNLTDVSHIFPETKPLF